MREPVVAGALAYSVDNFGTLWLRVFDVHGGTICICTVPREGALHLAGFIAETCDDDDEVGEVAGNA